MKNDARSLRQILAISIPVFAACAAAAAAPPSASYRLVYGDEFLGSALDTMKWNYNYPWGSQHNHRAYMDPSQVKLAGGKLNLQAVAVRNPNATDSYADGAWQQRDYTSGAINSSGKFNATYGYFEGVMKMQNTTGSWPAFWMLQDGWPPEIDVMEFPRGGGNSATQYWTNYHYTNDANAHASYGWQDAAPDVTAGYHAYGVEWTATQMKFYFDGNLHHTINDPNAIADAAGMYMILNHAVGGWAGDPAANSAFPIDFLIDSVKVWQVPANPATDTTWIGGSGSWDDAAKWTVQVPRFEDQIARFAGTGSLTYTANWTNSRTIGGLYFDGPTSYLLGSGAAGLQFAKSATGASATVTVAATNTGLQRVNARLELWDPLLVTNSSPQALVFAGSVIGDQPLTKAGPGTLILAGSNGGFTGGVRFAAGANVGNQGVVRLTNANALGTAAVDLPATGESTETVELLAGISVANPLTTAGRQLAGTTAVSVFLRNVSSDNAWTGPITITTGSGGAAIESASGTLTLAGTLTNNLASGGTRVFTLRGAGNGNVTGQIKNGLIVRTAVAKSDAGTWTLANANAYTGGTSVDGGTLKAAAAGSLGNGLITVSGGRLLAANANAWSATSTAIVSGGSVELQAGLASAAVLRSLALSGTGLVELHDNGLVLDTLAGGDAQALADVRAQLLAGRIAATLPSADARYAVGYASVATLGLTSFKGVALDGSAVVLRAALKGDANLDDAVDFADLLAVAQNYDAAPAAAKVWTDGDADADGIVNFTDLLALAQNYDAATLTGGRSLASAAGVPPTFAADWALAQSLVPEPTGIATLAVFAGFATTRRRRA